MKFKIQIVDTSPTYVGNPWRTVKVFGNQAVAERVAQNMRKDDRNATIRVIESGRARVLNQVHIQ
jgi:hypothetical protein